ncbi:MAG: hypothetical protein VZQ61_06615 [Christensenellaceae bacterium]
MAKTDDLNRAAQFLPFDALKGLSEELQSRIDRRSKISRIELSEEQQEILSDELNKVQRGNRVRVNFFLDGHYIDLEGIVEKTDSIYHYLVIGQEKIYYRDIYSIYII